MSDLQTILSDAGYDTTSCNNEYALSPSSKNTIKLYIKDLSKTVMDVLVDVDKTKLQPNGREFIWPDVICQLDYPHLDVFKTTRCSRITQLPMYKKKEIGGTYFIIPFVLSFLVCATRDISKSVPTCRELISGDDITGKLKAQRYLYDLDKANVFRVARPCRSWGVITKFLSTVGNDIVLVAAHVCFVLNASEVQEI